MLIIRTWKAIVILAVPIFFLGLLILAFVGFKITEKPGFCTTCHYMKPYYKSWKESAHNQISCLKCHYEPGIRGEVMGKFQATSQLVKYVTKTYGTKPWAEVGDKNCLQEGCHLKEKLFERKVKFKEQVLFDHQQHLGDSKEDIELRCTSCHSQILRGEHFSVAESVCFTCHFKKRTEEKEISRCGSCHGAPRETIVRQGMEIEHEQFLEYGAKCETCHVDVTRGTGEVHEERCLSCHDQTGKEFRDPKFLHDTHVTERKVECFECHAGIKHGLTNVAKLLDPDCKSCHTLEHSPQRQMYMGTGGEGVPDSPSPMFSDRVYCTGCHQPDGEDTSSVAGARLAQAKGEACVKCHGEGYDQMLLDWQSMLGETISEVKVLKNQVEQRLEEGGLSGENLTRARKLYQEAEYNLEFVERGRGEHNVGYADSLLSAARDNFEECLRLLKTQGE